MTSEQTLAIQKTAQINGKTVPRRIAICVTSRFDILLSACTA